MKTLKSAILSYVSVCVLAACGGGGDNAAPPTVASQVDAVSKLEQAYGGPDGLKEFFDTHTESEIAQTLRTYGMDYRVHALPDVSERGAEKITDCQKYFPAEDRSVWHNFDGEFYYIDSSGRPNRAYKDLPPIAKAPRITSCQSQIGRWGDEENPNNDYDGGHLIGAQLGGWGGRANIVPQDSNFNQGRWVEMESKMAKCGSLPSARLRYTITVGYANSSNLVPNSFEMSIRNRASNDSVTLRYQNVDGGGSNGASENSRGLAFLTDNGC